MGSAATVVLGNHDLHLLAMAFAPKGVRKREKELEAVLDAPDAAELLDWLASRPLLHRERGIRWTLIHAGLPPEWSLADAERCAREVERALRKDAPGLLAAMYGDAPDRWTPALEGAPKTALHSELPDAPATRRPQGPARALAQGRDRGRAARHDAVVPASGARDARGRLRVRPLVGARLPRRAWPPVPRHGLCLGRGAHRAKARRRRGPGPVAVPEPTPRGTLISRRGRPRRPPTGRRSGPRSAGRCGCPPAGAECS